jgi:hypothetical protein
MGKVKIVLYMPATGKLDCMETFFKMSISLGFHSSAS